MKIYNSKFDSVRLIFLVFLALLFFCPVVYSQNYTKEVIELWGNASIPFNKEGITLSETIDSTGRRISQISNPILETNLFNSQQHNCKHPNTGLKIILKLDDLAVKNGENNCLETLSFLKEKQIKASFGIIPSRCDNTALMALRPYLQAKNWKGENLFEIWHHGLDHINPEFFGTGYEYQKSHFEKADKMILEYLGIQMHSFGSPYNASDSITNRVISENPEYKVFMFSKVVPSNTNGIKYLSNRTNMENGTGNPEFKFFVENYIANKDKYSDYMILQGHPNKWTADKIEQFEQIVDFLISENCEFVLPYEYYQSF